MHVTASHLVMAVVPRKTRHSRSTWINSKAVENTSIPLDRPTLVSLCHKRRQDHMHMPWKHIMEGFPLYASADLVMTIHTIYVYT